MEELSSRSHAALTSTDNHGYQRRSNTTPSHSVRFGVAVASARTFLFIICQSKTKNRKNQLSMSPEFTFEITLRLWHKQVAHIYFFHILKKFGSFRSSVCRNATSPHTLVKNTGYSTKKKTGPRRRSSQTECKQPLAWLSIRTGVHELQKMSRFPSYSNEKALAPRNRS